MRPPLLRPEPRFLLSVSRSIDRPLNRSGLTTLTRARRPGEVGLTLTSGMALSFLREVDFLPRFQADVGLLPVAAAAGIRAKPLRLASDIGDLNAIDLDLEQKLDRGLDLGFRRILDDAKGHLRVLVRD